MARILTIRLSSLGDLAQELPIQQALHEAGHAVACVVEERFAAVYDLVPFPLEVLVWRRGLRGTLALRGAGRGFDRICDLQGNWKSAVLGWSLAGSRVLRPARRDLREASSALVPSRRASPARGRHVLERSWHVVRTALDLDLEAGDLPRPPFLRPDSTQAVTAELARLGIGGDGPFIACLHGPAADPRSWPLAKALELGARVDLPLVHVVGPAERGLTFPPATQVLRQMPTALSELCALGAVLRARKGIAVGHDGGAMHLLRASGARTLFLFGPQDPERTGPFEEPVLRSPGELGCRPCRARRCRLPEGNRCMQEIDPGEVGKALSAALAGG